MRRILTWGSKLANLTKTGDVGIGEENTDE